MNQYLLYGDKTIFIRLRVENEQLEISKDLYIKLLERCSNKTFIMLLVLYHGTYGDNVIIRKEHKLCQEILKKPKRKYNSPELL